MIYIYTFLYLINHFSKSSSITNSTIIYYTNDLSAVSQFGGQIYSSALYNTVQPRRPSLPTSAASGIGVALPGGPLLASSATRESIARAAHKAAAEVIYRHSSKADTVDLPKLVSEDVKIGKINTFLAHFPIIYRRY